MFDNPFDSFHNAVAEAKEEREQLDRLLTISTPRERLLVVVIAVTIAAFATWLFLGQVNPSVSINGTYTFADQGTQASNESTRTNIVAKSGWLTHKEVQRLSTGLGASIEVTTSDRETIALNGEVSRIDATRVSREPQQAGTHLGLDLYQVHFTSSEEIERTGISDGNCRIIIELNPQAPISLFGLRQS